MSKYKFEVAIYILAALLLVFASCTKAEFTRPHERTVADIAERQFFVNDAKARPVAAIDLTDYWYFGSYTPLQLTNDFDTPSPIPLENLSLTADSTGFLVSATDTINDIEYRAVEFDTTFQGNYYNSVIVLDPPVGPNLIYADQGKRIWGKTIVQLREDFVCEDYGVFSLRGTSLQPLDSVDYDPFTDYRGRRYQTSVLNAQVELIHDSLPTIFGNCSGFIRTELPSNSITGKGTLYMDCDYNDPFFQAVCYGDLYDYGGFTDLQVISDMNSSFAIGRHGPKSWTDPANDCRDLQGATNKQVWYVQGKDAQGDPANIPLTFWKEIRVHMNGGDDSLKTSCE